MGAVEMALWDLKGKALGKPVHELLGGAQRKTIVPYASLQPAGHSFAEYRDALVESARNAKRLGFKAVKSEVTMNGPYAHGGMKKSYDRHTEVVAAVRAALGPDMVLMVDVQYLWEDAATCLSVVKDWAEFDLFFLETPIWSDNLDEYRKLAERAPMKIAAGEWLATRYEFEELMDRGQVQVAQPDVGRVGGLGEAKVVCDMAAQRGLIDRAALLEDRRLDLRHRPSRLHGAALRVHRVSAARALHRDAAQGAGDRGPEDRERRDPVADQAGVWASISTGTRSSGIRWREPKDLRMSLRTLTPTLSRFAVEGASETGRSHRVPSTAKRERDRVRVRRRRTGR